MPAIEKQSVIKSRFTWYACIRTWGFVLDINYGKDPIDYVILNFRYRFDNNCFNNCMIEELLGLCNCVLCCGVVRFVIKWKRVIVCTGEVHSLLKFLRPLYYYKFQDHIVCWALRNHSVKGLLSNFSNHYCLCLCNLKGVWILYKSGGLNHVYIYNQLRRPILKDY